MLAMEVVVAMVAELAVMVSMNTLLKKMSITNSMYNYSLLTQHIHVHVCVPIYTVPILLMSIRRSVLARIF